jgi:hypothetical protein
MMRFSITPSNATAASSQNQINQADAAALKTKKSEIKAAAIDSKITPATTRLSEQLDKLKFAYNAFPPKGVPLLTDSSLRLWAETEIYGSPKAFDPKVIDATLSDHSHLTARAQILLTPISMARALTPQSICRNPEAALGILRQVKDLAELRFFQAYTTQEDVLTKANSTFLKAKKARHQEDESTHPSAHATETSADTTKRMMFREIESTLETWKDKLMREINDPLLKIWISNALKADLLDATDPIRRSDDAQIRLQDEGRAEDSLQNLAVINLTSAERPASGLSRSSLLSRK